MGKLKGKRAANSGAAVKKEKTTGWVASTLSKSDLNKLRATGILVVATVVMMPGEEIVPHPEQGYRGHHFLPSLPPLPEGGDVPEAAIVAESEAADTGATPEANDDDEEDAESEAYQTKVSPPSATSREEKEVEKKRKRVEVVDDSESLDESSPKLVTPLSAALPSSPYPEDPFTMAQIVSTGEGLHPELPATDEGAGLDDFVVAKVNGPLATIAASPKLDDLEGSPRVLAKKKAKTSGALKGIQISSTPSSPPRDHPFTREMLDVATRFIELETENKQLRLDYEFEQSRSNDLAVKLKAAEKALEEARSSLGSAEQRLESERSARETREEDIRQRLEALNTSLLRRTEHPTSLLEEDKVDPTLDALSLLEGNNIYSRNVINNCRKAIVRLHGHVFPTEKLAPSYDLLELVRTFAAPVDPFINYRQSQRQSGVEVAMATLMAHGEPVDWKKVSSSYPKDATGKKKMLQPYLIEAHKYSGAFVATMQPTPGDSSSSAAPSTGAPAPEVQ
ncbi:hypothetical protein ACQ4PT_024296 [Festuca glaucescens]